MYTSRLTLLRAAAILTWALVWAALHDISRSAASDLTLEYAVLAISVPVFALVYGLAFRMLDSRGKTAWLGVTLGVLIVFDLSAASARFRPQYPNDFAVGSAFLAASLPVLAILSYRLLRMTQRQ